jgi:hypothetical protein
VIVHLVLAADENPLLESCQIIIQQEQVSDYQ